MDTSTFERLLYEDESTTLDFKSQQYLFTKASDELKSELLKDILGFANAWRRSEAYILIGVEHVRGGRANVIGIDPVDHLQDHSLQQFVNSLVTLPVRFHYEAFAYEGKQIGIIRIELQKRPAYLKRDYGKLRKDEVYVRRGSSTDPTRPASPAEIAGMGTDDGAQNAELSVEFAEADGDSLLGGSAALAGEYCKMPDELPDLAPPRGASVLGFDMPALDAYRTNRDYFRERAKYEVMTRLFRPIRLVVRNVGAVVARGVRVELTTPAGIGSVVCDEADMPLMPRTETFSVADANRFMPRNIGQRRPGGVEVESSKDRFSIAIDCGDMQPGRRVWSEVFYLARMNSGEVVLKGQVLAENLPQPQQCELVATLTVKQTAMSVDDLTELPSDDDE